ncbi:phosphoribosyltransferase [Haloquadratum walsbyi]|jgi:hypoxanthine phosphoribosyltransferase|uniref:Probable phosphoribosyltransferase n=1 Tax=Haloquadratum walsbyi (strain DSM 16790 / HBSQ001) TaxID=362976 RepID=Q18KQ5_HALWD|nr:phosphoribosyltransferase [Haloquadratum walsbyi]CAJ51389.1 probable phosphoribosyltransferase [Haloquadratum walsbyi DSM 16790]
MSDLPDQFNCTITNWEYIYDLCRDVSNQIRADSFDPDVVVALARGGWFAGRCLCDFLGLDDLTSLKMEHYVGTAQTTNEPEIRYPMPQGSVAEKDVLIIDDIADTGGSIERAYEYVTDRDPNIVRTATLQLLQTSAFEPDFIGERLETWAWVVYPWNFIEDMTDLLTGVMRKTDAETFTIPDLREGLKEYHSVERIEMEIAQPDRMEEVLDEMQRRGYVEAVTTNEASGDTPVETGDDVSQPTWRIVETDEVGV